MALSILDRPKGSKLSATANTTYSIISNGYGTAVLSAGSGLTTGTIIYIYNSFTSYNGYWLITAYGPIGFRMQRYSGGDYLEYSQDHIAITVYPSIADIKFSCIHLPIVYTLASNLWPFNSSDTIRNITGYANDNGHVRITLSGVISVNVGDFLDIEATSEDDLDGPFQVLTKYSDSQYTINAPYAIASDSAYTYSNATAQKYYNNYAAVISIYGGLDPTHQWGSLKPYELITTLKIIPDMGNIIKVNVAEILKEQLNIIQNRPNFDSMPYDLDRFCEFYITYAEQYDSSDGVTITTAMNSIISDLASFQGVAVDAKLPFKNRYSGFLSDYAYGDSSNLAIFLSDGQPMLFAGWYFDLSFLSIENTAAVIVTKNYDTSDVLISQVNSTIDIMDLGLLRIPFSVTSTEYYKLISAWNTSMINDWINGDIPVTGGNEFNSLINGPTIIASSTNIPNGAPHALHYILNGHIGDIVNITLTITSTLSVGVVVSLWNLAQNSVVQPWSGVVTNFTTIISYDTSILSFDPYYLLIHTTNISGFTNNSLQISVPRIQYINEKRVDVFQDCPQQWIYLTWKNYLGGFNYWLFNANKDYAIDISNVQTQNKNIFPNWPQSYNESEDTISFETSRTSVNNITVRAENLSKDQVEFISGIKVSSLVQQMTSKYDRRTMLVDATSFKKRTDNEGISSIEFTIRYTDNLPSQSL